MDFIENVGRRRGAQGDLGNFVNVGGLSLNGYERNALFRGSGGERFDDVGYLEGADRIEDGRGVAAADIDGDGDLDLVISNYLAPARLLVNRGTPGNHWLELKLSGAGPARGGSNRSALGAIVTVTSGSRRWIREVVSASGYLTGTTRTLHFGLGTAASPATVEIRWPSGRVQSIRDVAIDRIHRIEEPAGSPPPSREGVAQEHGRGGRGPDEPNPRTATLALTGTEGASFSGYYLRQGRRVDVTGVLPRTFTESGLSECEFRKVQPAGILTLEARDGASYLNFTAPPGVPGIRAKVTGGWNVGQAR